jgi:hypothetical protein
LGHYRVTFNAAFPAAPMVTASAQHHDENRVVNVFAAPHDFDQRLRGNSNQFVDGIVHFCVIGTR